MDRLGVIQKLFAAYPNTTASAATFAVYLEVFEDVPVEELHAVVMQCIREGSSFPPSSGQVFERWRIMHSPISPDMAVQGWLSVVDSLKSIPATPLNDPIAREAVKALGGISEIRRSENPGMDRAHFFRIYAELARSAADEQRLSSEYKQLRDMHQSGEDNGNGLVKRIEG